MHASTQEKCFRNDTPGTSIAEGLIGVLRDFDLGANVCITPKPLQKRWCAHKLSINPLLPWCSPAQLATRATTTAVMGNLVIFAEISRKTIFPTTLHQVYQPNDVSQRRFVRQLKSAVSIKIGLRDKFPFLKNWYGKATSHLFPSVKISLSL